MDDSYPGGDGPDTAQEDPSVAGPAEASRAHTPDERDLWAERRDELSALRDEIADKRDREAATTDMRDEVADRHTLRVDEIRARARETRLRAANDRERAAHDRKQAARDREQAARDREQAANDRRHAGTDELTGARRRGVGLEDLEREMKRARREGNGLVVAFVDVDGLKAVNDTHGHAAGDDVLRAVAERLRARMRSYDLLVRMGGDEFLCALPGVTVGEARERFRDLTVKQGAANTVSFGFSELLDEDTPDDLVRRADSDLLDSRRG